MDDLNKWFFFLFFFLSFRGTGCSQSFLLPQGGATIAECGFGGAAINTPVMIFSTNFIRKPGATATKVWDVGWSFCNQS